MTANVMVFIVIMLAWIGTGAKGLWDTNKSGTNWYFISFFAFVPFIAIFAACLL